MHALEALWPAVGRTVRAPSSRPQDERTGADVGRLHVVASVLCALGLLTVSWEVFGNLALGPYNVKLPVLLLSVSAVLATPQWIVRLRALWSASRTIRVVLGLSAAVLVVFAVRSLTSFPLGPGVAQTAAVVSGALLPALAVLGVVRDREDVVWALRWFLAGAVVTGVFGVYQLVAFYTGLPQGVVYTGVGTSGEGGRISAFSYEPAYFASFLVLAIGAVIAVARLAARPVSWRSIVFFSALLVLVNVRALLFLLPAAGVLVAVAWRRNRRLLVRWTVAGAAVALVVTALTTGASALQSALSAAPERPVATAAPGDDVEEDAPPARRPAGPRLPADVLDPSEPSSNGPRLDLYRAVLAVDLANPVVGVGPGHLRDALAADGYVAPNQGTNVVANNVWLQAASDGGIVLLLLEGALTASLVVLWWRTRMTAAHPILSTMLAVLGVGGMLTSYFFDIKLWVVAALGVLLVLEGGSDPQRASASA